VLQGPSGSGKSHLIGAYLGWAAELGVQRSALRYLQLKDDGEETSSYFISEYERLRSAGGVLLVELPVNVGKFNPHIESRLQAGVRCELAYPEEVELRPLVESLLERHHLVLPEASVDYLLVRLPLNPLSLESIIAAISESSFAANKSPKRGLIRGVLRERSDL
jgi:chromosomal replication initiation ATPase DnaA